MGDTDIYQGALHGEVEDDVVQKPSSNSNVINVAGIGESGDQNGDVLCSDITINKGVFDTATIKSCNQVSPSNGALILNDPGESCTDNIQDVSIDSRSTPDCTDQDTLPGEHDEGELANSPRVGEDINMAHYRTTGHPENTGSRGSVNSLMNKFQSKKAVTGNNNVSEPKSADTSPRRSVISRLITDSFHFLNDGYEASGKAPELNTCQIDTVNQQPINVRKQIEEFSQVKKQSSADGVAEQIAKFSKGDKEKCISADIKDKQKLFQQGKVRNSKPIHPTKVNHQGNVPVRKSQVITKSTNASLIKNNDESCTKKKKVPTATLR